MRVYGHGGLDADNLINSAESFPIVRAAGADGVELDVRLSADGAVVVIHDPHYADGRPVVATPVDERPSDVLTLDAALDLCTDLTVNIELKNYPQDEAFDPTEHLADAVVDLLAARGHRDDPLISCFGPAALDRVRDRSVIPTAFLVLSRKPPVDVVGRCVQLGHRSIHPYVDMVDEAFMHEARRDNLTVNVWTGFDETDETIERLIILGVDGVITANPQRSVRLRG